MSQTASELRLSFGSRAGWVRPVALGVVLAAGAFLGVGGIFDLLSDATGKLPTDHNSTFRAVTGISWHQAGIAAHPVTAYVTRAEAGYAVHELLFAVLFLVVAAIPLRRGERWAWWCCWLLVFAFAGFAALFGAHSTLNLTASIVVGVIVATALIALRPRTVFRRTGSSG